MRHLEELSVLVSSNHEVADLQKKVCELNNQLKETRAKHAEIYLSGYTAAKNEMLKSEHPNIYAVLQELRERVEALERRLDNI